ncbi:MAG: hypothetical protein H8K07_02055 [Nitrospira sp.]|jgi:hypothetical protein|nr:hypothetical protein [Nitrospira sp.]MDI3461969.1 hypothetical protein [Nitrospira sp.]
MELTQLEDKNRRLKQMVVDQAPDLHTLKAVTLKNWQGGDRASAPQAHNCGRFRDFP